MEDQRYDQLQTAINNLWESVAELRLFQEQTLAQLRLLGGPPLLQDAAAGFSHDFSLADRVEKIEHTLERQEGDYLDDMCEDLADVQARVAELFQRQREGFKEMRVLVDEEVRQQLGELGNVCDLVAEEVRQQLAEMGGPGVQEAPESAEEEKAPGAQDYLVQLYDVSDTPTATWVKDVLLRDHTLEEAVEKARRLVMDENAGFYTDGHEYSVEENYGGEYVSSVYVKEKRFSTVLPFFAAITFA